MPRHPSLFLTRASGSLLVVRRLHDDLHVVRVRLLETRRGDAHELAARLELLDGARADVEHRLTESSDELISDGGERPAIRDLAFDALGDELVVAGDVGLEVAVLGIGGLLATGLHRTERAHAAVLLE